MPGLILIVDPEELPRMELSVQLQEMGYRVETAENGREAIAVFQRSRPRLVITDLLLDHFSGFEISSRIAADSAHTCPVIFYTSFYRSESARQEVMRKYSAAGYFIKPFQLPQLKKVIAVLMGPEGNEKPDEPAEEEHLEIGQEPPPLLGHSWGQGTGLLTGGVESNDPSLVPVSEMLAGGITQETRRFFDLFKENPGLADAGVHLAPEPMMEPAAEEALLGELPADGEAKGPDQEPVEAIPQESRPTRAETLNKGLLTEESLPRSLYSHSASLRRHRFLKFVFVLALILLGLYLVYQYYRGRSSTGLFQTGSPPNGQSSHKAEKMFRSGQLPAEGKGEEPLAGSLPPSSKLPGSALSSEDRKPELVEPSSLNHLPPPVVQKSSSSTNRRSPPVSLVIVSDVSGQASPPYLRRSYRIEIPATVARSITKPLFVRLELNSAGKLVGMQVVNEREENAALVPIIIAPIFQWEFTPMESASAETIVKYFCFRVQTGGDIARADREQN
jgi:CheY-like chemotaxis protein